MELVKLPSFLCLLSLSELIHSLNKLPFEHLPACLIFLPEIKFGLIAFELGRIGTLTKFKNLLQNRWANIEIVYFIAKTGVQRGGRRIVVENNNPVDNSTIGTYC